MLRAVRGHGDLGGNEMMTRREMREHCFKMLFCADFYPAAELPAQMENYFLVPKEDEETDEGVLEILHDVDMEEKDCALLKERTGQIIRQIETLDEKINQVAEGWRTKRMGKVELTILRLAVYEMKYDEEIPQKVAINEAVELAKKFGGKDSPGFINGILAKLV